MIDLHHHLLWGVDDGPGEVEEAIGMAGMAVAQGFTGVIMTPHHMKGKYENPVAVLKEKATVLREALRTSGIHLDLYLGHEVFADLDTPEEVRGGQILTLNGSGYLLIEFPFSGIPPYEEAVVFQLLQQGIRPIIAHPERIEMPVKDLGVFEDFVKKGCLLQINAASLTGHNGREAQRRGKQLILRHMGHLLATDAHNTMTRPPLIREALLKVEKWVGADEAARIMARAEDILKDRVVRIDAPVTVKRKLFTLM